MGRIKTEDIDFILYIKRLLFTHQTKRNSVIDMEIASIAIKNATSISMVLVFHVFFLLKYLCQNSFFSITKQKQETNINKFSRCFFSFHLHPINSILSVEEKKMLHLFEIIMINELTICNLIIQLKQKKTTKERFDQSRRIFVFLLSKCN